MKNSTDDPSVSRPRRSTRAYSIAFWFAVAVACGSIGMMVGNWLSGYRMLSVKATRAVIVGSTLIPLIAYGYHADGKERRSEADPA